MSVLGSLVGMLHPAVWDTFRETREDTLRVKARLSGVSDCETELTDDVWTGSVASAD